ncbi:MAG TPA: redoxin domain-containing protein [Verrucomicrobium sp.]|nr:redoxin domain-containing protein [Verrucomicrobium sp.]
MSKLIYLILAVLGIHSVGFAAAPPKAVVYLFTVPDCPVANAMMPEMVRVAEAFTVLGVAFHLVYVDGDTPLPQAKTHAAAYQWKWAVETDPKHVRVKALGATRTPEVFVVRQDGSTAYHGRINDLYYAPGQRRRSPTQHDLKEALQAILAGRPIAKPHQPATGCIIADFQS